jgi:hypothetical protein
MNGTDFISLIPNEVLDLIRNAAYVWGIHTGEIRN